YLSERQWSHAGGVLPPPLVGRGIAYGNSRVASATWERSADDLRRKAGESERERTRIETRTAVGASDKSLLGAVRRGRAFSICDSPALVGVGSGVCGESKGRC